MIALLLVTLAINIPSAALFAILWFGCSPWAALGAYFLVAAMLACESSMGYFEGKRRGHGDRIGRAYYEVGFVHAVLFPLFWLADVRIATAWWWHDYMMEG